MFPLARITQRYEEFLCTLDVSRAGGPCHPRLPNPPTRPIMLQAKKEIREAFAKEAELAARLKAAQDKMALAALDRNKESRRLALSKVLAGMDTEPVRPADLPPGDEAGPP